MKRLNQISIFFFLISAIGCSTQAETPTTLPITGTIEFTETPSSNSTPTTSPSQIPEQVSIEFPDWVKNPETQILLVPIGTRENGYDNMALFNAETGERFDIPFTLDTKHYFWLPDGSGFGFLSNRQKQILLYSTMEGSALTINLSDEAVKFYEQNTLGDFPNPVQVTTSTITNKDFLIIPYWRLLSPNRKYFEYNENYDNTYTSIYDVSSKKIFIVSDPSDSYFDLFWEFSPDSKFIAISQSDTEQANFYSFNTKPTIRLRIYDVQSQQLVTSYKNVTFPKWSPDGTKFLFQEWRNKEGWYWYGEAPPCIFNTLNGITNCYDEVVAQHKKSNTIQTTISSLQWSPDQSMISYITFNVNQNPYKEYGSFCVIALSTNEFKCKLDVFEFDGQKIIRYTWSPGSRYISFIYDTSCPYCDYSDYPQIGIADIQTGEYFSTGSYDVFYMGLWRPSPNP